MIVWIRTVNAILDGATREVSVLQTEDEVAKYKQQMQIYLFSYMMNVICSV